MGDKMGRHDNKISRPVGRFSVLNFGDLKVLQIRKDNSPSGTQQDQAKVAQIKVAAEIYMLIRAESGLTGNEPKYIRTILELHEGHRITDTTSEDPEDRIAKNIGGVYKRADWSVPENPQLANDILKAQAKSILRAAKICKLILEERSQNENVSETSPPSREHEMAVQIIKSLEPYRSEAQDGETMDSDMYHNFVNNESVLVAGIAMIIFEACALSNSKSGVWEELEFNSRLIIDPDARIQSAADAERIIGGTRISTLVD